MPELKRDEDGIKGGREGESEREGEAQRRR